MTNELRLSAVNFGFSQEWLTQTTLKYGTGVLALIVEASRHGLSVFFIVEAVNVFGPDLLSLIVNAFNKKKMMAEPTYSKMGEWALYKNVTPETWIQGDDVTPPAPVPPPIVTPPVTDEAAIQALIDSYLPIIIEKYIPYIITNYGPQLIQLIISNEPKIQALIDQYLPTILNNYLPQLVGLLSNPTIQTLIDQYLPNVLNTYAPQVLQFILQYITNNLQKK